MRIDLNLAPSRMTTIVPPDPVRPSRFPPVSLRECRHFFLTSPPLDRFPSSPSLPPSSKIDSRANSAFPPRFLLPTITQKITPVYSPLFFLSLRQTYSDLRSPPELNHIVLLGALTTLPISCLRISFFSINVPQSFYSFLFSSQ